MATLNINIPDDKLDYILDGLAARYSYSAEIPNPEYNPIMQDNPDYDPGQPESESNPVLIPGVGYNGIETIPNPQSKAAFAKERIIDFIKYEVSHGYKIIAQEGINNTVDQITLS